MKKLFKVALVAVGLIFAGNFVQAQSKIGHINFQALVTQMPEYKTIQSTLDLYQKTFVDQLTTMNNGFTAEAKDFQTKGPTMSDAVRTAKQTELQDMQKRIQDYQNTAQQQVEAKSNELFKPLSDKARAAITEIAKEKGYSYVLDSSQIQLLVSPDGDDLMSVVKLKLGMK
jgi:outer membrane protein